MFSHETDLHYRTPLRKNSTETRQKLAEIGGGAKLPYADLNTKVFDWFCSDRARNTPNITSEDSDDHVATQARSMTTQLGHDRWQPNWDRALLDEAKVATDASSEVGEKVVPSTTAWSHSSDLLKDALSTNNAELIALLSQARELFNRSVARLLTAPVRCLSPTSFPTSNTMLDPTTVKNGCFYLKWYYCQSLYTVHCVYVQCVLHDNLIQYNNACIIFMSDFNVGPAKEVLPQQRPPAI